MPRSKSPLRRSCNKRMKSLARKPSCKEKGRMSANQMYCVACFKKCIPSGSVRTERRRTGKGREIVLRRGRCAHGHNMCRIMSNTAV